MPTCFAPNAIIPNCLNVLPKDLTHIADADVKGVAAPCCQQVFCCGKGMDRVEIKTSSDGNKALKLKRGEGEPVSRKIMNQVEEAQRIERD